MTARPPDREKTDRACKGAQRRHDRGFTLLELLVVLAILAIIATFAAPQVLKYLGGAKTDAARIQIQNLSTVLDLYRLEVGSYPSQEAGLAALVERPAGAEIWNGPYLKKSEALSDPWGRPYIEKKRKKTSRTSKTSKRRDASLTNLMKQD